MNVSICKRTRRDERRIKIWIVNAIEDNDEVVIPMSFLMATPLRE